MPKKCCIDTEAIEFSYQYRHGLLKVLRNIESGKTSEYKILLKDKKLIKLILCKATDTQRPVTDIIEELLIRALKKDTCYKKYFDNELMDVTIATRTAVEFFKHKPDVAVKGETSDFRDE
jgi:hypothetical protein